MRCEDEDEADEFDRYVENEVEWLSNAGTVLNEMDDDFPCEVGRPFFSSAEQLRKGEGRERAGQEGEGQLWSRASSVNTLGELLQQRNRSTEGCSAFTAVLPHLDNHRARILSLGRI